MRLGDDSFIVGCSRYFGSNMIATVLSVGASRDCKWDIEMGMEFSEYHSFGSNTMSGIKDCSFEDVVRSGRVLSVPDASILLLCEVLSFICFVLSIYLSIYSLIDYF